jgi:HrpA-like RNA helicase
MTIRLIDTDTRSIDLASAAGKIFDVEENYRPISEEDDYSVEESASKYSDDDSTLSCSDDANEFQHRANNPFRIVSIAETEKSLVQHATSVLFDDIVCASKVEGDVLIFFSFSCEIWECVESINSRARKENKAQLWLIHFIQVWMRTARARQKIPAIGLDLTMKLSCSQNTIAR